MWQAGPEATFCKSCGEPGQSQNQSRARRFGRSKNRQRDGASRASPVWPATLDRACTRKRPRELPQVPPSLSAVRWARPVLVCNLRGPWRAGLLPLRFQSNCVHAGLVVGVIPPSPAGRQEKARRVILDGACFLFCPICAGPGNASRQGRRAGLGRAPIFGNLAGPGRAGLHCSNLLAPVSGRTSLMRPFCCILF